MDIPALPFCHSELKAPKPLPHQYPQTLTTLGDHLRKKRLDLKLLQTDVAKIFGTHANTVTYWETNRGEPSLRLIPKIIDFLGYVPLSILPQEPGKRIAFYRRLFGLSQEELARRLRIDPGTLLKWEKGRGLHSELYEEVAPFLAEALHGIGEAKIQVFNSYQQKQPSVQGNEGGEFVSDVYQISSQLLHRITNQEDKRFAQPDTA